MVSVTVQQSSDGEYFIEVPIEILASVGIKSGAQIQIELVDGGFSRNAMHPVPEKEALESYR